MKKNIIFIVVCHMFIMVQSQNTNSDLYVFNFGKDSLSIQERVSLYSKLGYKGLTLPLSNKKRLDNFKAYLENPLISSGELTIPAVFYHHNFDRNSDKKEFTWRNILSELPQSTAMWVIVSGNSANKDKVLQLFDEMSYEAGKQGKDIVIYPHDRTFIESAEETLYYLEKLQSRNLFTTLHLCHELREGNGNRLLEVAIKVAPYLKFASISGSNITMKDWIKADWSDAIKPLDEGDFNVEEFVEILQKIRFSGKVFLHTFGIKQEPRHHLERSMKTWNKMVSNTYEKLTSNLNFILDNPENAYWDKNSKSWYISNLGGEKVTIEEDGYGWITKIDKNGKVVEGRWVEHLDAPTGMASYNGHLYVADRGVLVKINIETAKIVEKIKLPGARFPNDVASSDNGDIYVSDTYENIIYKVTEDGKVEVFLKNEKLECPNGLWVDGDNLIVATWGPMTNEATFETSRKGTLLKINTKTKSIVPIGKGLPIANFDGIVKYKDYYYGTDWVGGRLLKISEDGKVEEILRGFEQFADLGVDKEKGVLMIPEMSKNRFILVNLKAL